MDPSHPAGDDPSAETPLQFGIRDLMIAQAVVLVSIGLLVMAHVFGLLAIFIATLVLCYWRVWPERETLKRGVVDLLGGVILPILCYLYDPGFLEFGGGLLCLAIATEIVILLVWLLAGRWLTRWSGMLAGGLLVGAIVSGAIGIGMLPFGVIGLLALGLGALAFTPWLTCVVFTRNMREALRKARATVGDRRAIVLFVAGALLAVAIPALIYVSAGPWIDEALKLMPRPKPPF